MTESQVPSEIVKRCRSWQILFVTYAWCHVLLGTIGILASLTVAYLAFALSSKALIAILSLVAAVCTAMNYFFLPERQSRAYVGAWRLLSSAIIKYQTTPEPDIRILHDAIDKGEEIIARHIY